MQQCKMLSGHPAWAPTIHAIFLLSGCNSSTHVTMTTGPGLNDDAALRDASAADAAVDSRSAAADASMEAGACGPGLGTYIVVQGDLAYQKLTQSCPSSGDDPSIGPTGIIAGGGEGPSSLVMHACGAGSQPSIELRLPATGVWQFGNPIVTYASTAGTLSSSPLGQATVSFTTIPDAAPQAAAGSIVEGDYNATLYPATGAAQLANGHFRVCFVGLGRSSP
jgi:hypothetical protein